MSLLTHCDFSSLATVLVEVTIVVHPLLPPSRLPHSRLLNPLNLDSVLLSGPNVADRAGQVPSAVPLELAKRRTTFMLNVFSNRLPDMGSTLYFKEASLHLVMLYLYIQISSRMILLVANGSLSYLILS